MAVRRLCCARALGLWLGVSGVLFLGAGIEAGEKVVHLRNETIRTTPPSRPAVRAQTVEPAVSGLYLVQFADRPQEGWRVQLRQLGVELLNYVPEDAFVARFAGVRLGQLRALPFVQWVGEYSPALKIHRRVTAAVAGPAGVGPVRVRVLLAPGSAAAEVAVARRAFARLGRVSPTAFGIILEGWLRPGRLAALARSPAVLWVEPGPRFRMNDEVATQIVGGVGTAPHRTAVQQLGFSGRNVIVSVADSGLDNGDAATMHPDLAGRVDAFFAYGGLPDAADEHSHGTHVAGIVAADGATGETDENGFLYGLGVAPEAHLVAQRVFDADGNDYLPPMELLTRDAGRAGAVIGSNSWGDDTQGGYDLHAAQFDALVRDADAQTPGEQPYILEFSAGNAGPGAQTLDSPAVAKNVIATGASENDRVDFFIYADGPEVVADFSSRGPCEDGRIKPDLVAPGTWIASLQSASATDQYAWLPISENYQYQGGTSQAGPHASGAAAVFVQFYRETHGGVNPSPALVKAALINSAQPLDPAAGGPEAPPNQDEGWGRVNLPNLIGAERRYEFFDQAVLLTNSQTFEHHVLVGDPDAAFKVTLAYTDMPGFPAALPALVNDLDLEVIGPDGALYRGNQFQAGDSIPNPEAVDRLNNVEGVHLQRPLPGDYLVRVRAIHVVEDIHHRTNGPPRQDFALVVSGDLASPGVGILAMDRGAYRVPGLINLKLVDFDLAGQGSVAVRIKSASEPAGEAVTLLAFGARGVFTGAVATATGPAAPDGRLQVRDGDTIQADYADAAPPATRTATAVADLTPPRISAVGTTNHFGQIKVTWETDEPATSIVRYGPDTKLTAAITNRVLETSHEMLLPGFARGTTVLFLVIAADEAGNVSTNDNAGRLYRFVVPAAPTVLVVDAFQDPFGLFDIPVSAYTDALDGAGFSYAVWDVAGEGRTPGLNDLLPFRVVMWRVPELTASLTAADAKALRDYVNNGGGLFISSMELLTRLEESGLTNFRKNVLHVESYTEDVGVPAIAGVENASLTSGVQADLDYSAYPDLIIIVPDLSDTFQPTTNAAAILFEASSGQPVGLRFPATGEEAAGRVIFLSFPLDTISLDGPPPNNRVELARRFLSFLAPGVEGVGALELDRAQYGLPARAAVELADADLAGRGQATVKFLSDHLPQGQAVTLAETPQPGLFRGYVTLVAETNVLGPGQFAARDGERVRVQYADASLGQTLEVVATVDMSRPVISQVAAAPEYAEATISWETSEPADTLVQFGESKFLGRTAYAAELTLSHSLTLTGLLPDRSYFYQVVSRDAAGNAAIADRQGKLYFFHTLKPLAPPFADNLERGATNWVVVNEDLGDEIFSIGASTAWELGTPHNELATAAHSGANCWGTNLRGEGNDYANTSLVSPALNLVGGNVATLRFWQNYDFTPRAGENDLYELGAVYVSTNNGAGWIGLGQLLDTSGGWEEIEVDLSPYAGQVVRLGWAYALFSIDAVEHPGWLVDDVSVTVAKVERGVVLVTNNLAQARFHLRGPVSAEGAGWSLALTNAPPGQYVLQFDPVPYYATPAPQTNLLSGTNTISFGGAYTFTDANHNGISDAWELQFFGAVAPNHAPGTDTDGDGSSDYAEFIAGTSPVDPGAPLSLWPPVIQANRTVRLDWRSMVGRAYRAQLSTDLVGWLPATAWVIATSTNSSLTLPPLTDSPGFFFRLEVRP